MVVGQWLRGYEPHHLPLWFSLLEVCGLLGLKGRRWLGPEDFRRFLQLLSSLLVVHALLAGRLPHWLELERLWSRDRFLCQRFWCLVGGFLALGLRAGFCCGGPAGTVEVSSGAIVPGLRSFLDGSLSLSVVSAASLAGAEPALVVLSAVGFGAWKDDVVGATESDLIFEVVVFTVFEAALSALVTSAELLLVL